MRPFTDPDNTMVWLPRMSDSATAVPPKNPRPKLSR